LALSLKHSTFGGFCLEANEFEKAEKHLIKSKEIITDKYKIPYSNFEYNMGNLESQRKNYQGAVDRYLQAIDISPHNPNSKPGLPV
jgi:tetratricopeptide (TPR) repeat protein